MSDLRPEHESVLRKIRKELGLPQVPPTPSPPTSVRSSPTDTGNGSSGRPPGDPTSSLLARIAETTDLMTFLGFDNLTEHRKEIKLYYLIGCCYHHKGRSARHILQMLASPPPDLVADDLTLRAIKCLKKKNKAPKVISNSLHKLMEMLSDYLQTEVKLVNYLGEGEAFDGLTEVGERFWQLVADYLRIYL